ncbi:unnamed protein product [Mytilus coruscus]|uniref:Chitin-binding type-2 domain-containing protein n=1 Tax=Mytilus coruscus TaxID=42192 RepID=A0A6J8A5H2_MYTCO|nr:unnamed protein product [Mytilus coruscus]
MGLIRKVSFEEYWNKHSPSQSTPWFRCMFSRNRFQNILKFLHLVDTKKLPKRNDPAYKPSQKVQTFDFVNRKFLRYYNPRRELAVDESLVGTKGKTSMLQYIPSKRSRFGVKFWMLVESVTGYVLQMDVYHGKRFDPTPVATLQGTNVVMNLMKNSHLLGKGFHVFADSFFTSLNLANKLLRERTYLTGTMRTINRPMPQMIKDIPHADGFQKQQLLLNILVQVFSTVWKMNCLYFFFIVLISLCYPYGGDSWEGHTCTRKKLQYRTSYYCSCKRLWWCCGRSARNTPYYTSEMICCPGWRHNGNQDCSIAIVERIAQNTTNVFSQEITTTEVGRTTQTSMKLMTSEQETTMLTATKIDVKSNDDMTTTSVMTTSTNNEQTKQPRLEGNDAIVEKITQNTTEVLSQDITTDAERTTPTSTKLMTSEEATTMFTATTMDVKTNDDMTTTSPMTTSTNTKQTIQPPVEGNGKSEFDCPEEFGFFPDSTDCNKFFVCNWNDGYSFDCPPGTHWNQTITICDIGEDC